MIRFEHTDVVGWEPAIRGMRNPMNSWDKSDSGLGCYEHLERGEYVKEHRLCKDCGSGYSNHCSGSPTFTIGNNDKELMRKLYNAGTDHRKFMRMIIVYVDITAPLYWWKEFDTYRCGVEKNSCSTIHKIHTKEFELDDFSHDQLLNSQIQMLHSTIEALNNMRYNFINYNNLNVPCYVDKKDYWWQMIQLLPSSYNQKRTVMMSYEAIANMYKSRKDHKLDEWRIGFCDWVKELPYSNIIIGE